MQRNPFKEHIITRTCTEKLSPYTEYRDYLEKDFSGRCCYCNMSDELLTTSFHIDHFIPRKVFEGKKDYLLTKYDNLMLACPKCNLSKSDAYKGDIVNDSSITNEYFYNPDETDYNLVFYRNYLGGIQSDDPKGKEMIKRLRLYRLVHNMAWLVDEYRKVFKWLSTKIDYEKDPTRKEELEKIQGKIAIELVKMEESFKSVYMGRKIPYYKQ